MNRIFIAVIICLVLISAVPALGVDPLFVHLEEAIPQGGGRVLLVCLVENNANSDIISLDLELEGRLSSDRAEASGGWGISKQSERGFRVHTLGRLRPGSNGRFKIMVSGDLDIFRGRSARSLLTVTAQYSDGRKRVVDVGAPMIRDLR